MREDLSKRRTDVLLHGEDTRRKGLSGKQKQMPTFIQRESEHTCKTLQHLRRRVDIAPLFQPDIPGDADIGKLCDPFTAQSRSPPVTACRQATLPQPVTGRCAAFVKNRREPADIHSRSWCVLLYPDSQRHMIKQPWYPACQHSILKLSILVKLIPTQARLSQTGKSRY